MERQSVVTHTLQHNEMRTHITRQLGHNDTVCQNVVSAKKRFVLIFLLYCSCSYSQHIQHMLSLVHRL